MCCSSKKFWTHAFAVLFACRMTEVVADEAGRTFVDDKTSEWAELGAVVARRLAQHQAVGRFEGLTEVDYTFTWFFPGLGSGLQMRVFFVNLLQPETEGEHLRHVGGRHCLDLGQELDRICGEVLHVVAPELFTTPFLFGRGPLLTTLGCTSALWCLISRPVVGGGAILLLLIRALDKLGGHRATLRRAVPCPAQVGERAEETGERHKAVEEEDPALCAIEVSDSFRD